MGEHWVPKMGGGFSPPSPTDETITMRRRIRHNASVVGGQVSQRPVFIDVQHLRWQDDAACVGTDPEAFFPDGTPEISALRVCEVCPVKQECADYAIPDATIKGIWGGLNEKQRGRIREKRTRERRKAAG